MNRIYIETPIDQVEGLEDGIYGMPTSMLSSIAFVSGMFKNGEWAALPRTPITGYLRPAPDNSFVVGNEIVEMAFQWWVQKEQWVWHENGYYYQLDYPHQWPAPRTAIIEELWDKFIQTKLAQQGK